VAKNCLFTRCRDSTCFCRALRHDISDRDTSPETEEGRACRLCFSRVPARNQFTVVEALQNKIIITINDFRAITGVRIVHSLIFRASISDNGQRRRRSAKMPVKYGIIVPHPLGQVAADTYPVFISCSGTSAFFGFVTGNRLLTATIRKISGELFFVRRRHYFSVRPVQPI
jgi:hypothetical protein